jgi:vitamin B12 transporter
MHCRKIVVLVACLSMFLMFSSFVSAAMSQEEENFLDMYFTSEELQVISTTRSLQSITRVAENVEVVTKEDIELMNAHTLADVVNTINGVVVFFSGAAPGSQAVAQIQGSRIEYGLVLVDGVSINDIAGS